MHYTNDPFDTERYYKSRDVACFCDHTGSTQSARPADEGKDGYSSTGDLDGLPNLDTTLTSRDFVPSDTAQFNGTLLSPGDFCARTADCLDNVAETESNERRRTLRRKAAALRRCGRFVVARRCSECGEIDRYSGHIFASCSLRVCPYCSKHKAALVVGQLIDAIRQIPRQDGYTYSILTFTTRYEPERLEHLSVNAIEQRIKKLQKAVSYVWKRVLQSSEGGLLAFFEVSKRGEVHAHTLYYGPRLNFGTVRVAYQIALSECGYVDIRPLHNPYENLPRLLYYFAKGPSSQGEILWPTRSSEFMNPELAARVEIALGGKRLFERYGAFRKPVRKPHRSRIEEERLDLDGSFEPVQPEPPQSDSQQDATTAQGALQGDVQDAPEKSSQGATRATVTATQEATNHEKQTTSAEHCSIPDETTNNAVASGKNGEEIERPNASRFDPPGQEPGSESPKIEEVTQDCCPRCGCLDPQWDWVLVPIDEWLEQAAEDWLPRVTRSFRPRTYGLKKGNRHVRKVAKREEFSNGQGARRHFSRRSQNDSKGDPRRAHSGASVRTNHPDSAGCARLTAQVGPHRAAPGDN
jgi:hypothetical protein